MKKKLVAVFVLVMSVLFLAACGKESMDGKYYEYWIASNTGEEQLEATPMVIDGINVSNASGFDFDLTIDEEKKIFISKNNREFPYVYEKGILVFNGDTYYKEGTQVYKDKLKELEQSEK